MFSNLIAWSEKHFAHLPWRRKRSLYNTLVSEIMLQQTTVSTVINYFEPFIRQFPDLENLALAPEEELLTAWRGLGYYRRVKNLRRGAVYILTELQGRIPTDYQTLTKIPGIGPYTALALLSIGQNKKSLALDANLERVLARFYALDNPQGLHLKRELAKRFAEGTLLAEMEHLGPRPLTEALMDLGRTLCKAGRTSCPSCPLAKHCQSYIQGNVLDRPVISRNKKARFYQLDLLRVVVQKREGLLAYRKKENRWLANQLELPTFIIDSEDKKLTQYPWMADKTALEKIPRKLLKVKTTITKYRIQNHILVCSPQEFQKLFPQSSLYSYYSKKNCSIPFSNTTVKIFNLLDKKD